MLLRRRAGIEDTRLRTLRRSRLERFAIRRKRNEPTDQRKLQRRGAVGTIDHDVRHVHRVGIVLRRGRCRDFRNTCRRPRVNVSVAGMRMMMLMGIDRKRRRQ